jgi:hypothetical protein
LRKYTGDFFYENEIDFEFIEPAIPTFGSKDYEEYLTAIKELEGACEQEFWNTSEKNEDYREISNFNPFNNQPIPIQYLESFRKFKYNTDGWSSYISKLIKFCFPEFDIQSETGNVVRFAKKLNEELFLGIEFDKKYFLSRLKDADPDVSYLNLILFNNSFDLGMKQRPYILKYNDKVLSLGILGNPFFYRPCFSLSSFAVVELYYFKEDENGWRAMLPRYSWGKKENGDGTFTLIHPEEYGEKLKKHAFFYFDALAYSSRSYLTYLEKSILDSI